MTGAKERRCSGSGPRRKRRQMLLGRVALVAGEAVIGMPGIQGHHLRIPGDLGQDRGGGDGRMASIALDHGLARQAMARQAVAVHQQVFGCWRQAINGAAHRQMGGMVDVERSTSSGEASATQ